MDKFSPFNPFANYAATNSSSHRGDPFPQDATNGSHSHDYPIKPPHFIRVTDNTTLTKFDPEEGFNTGTTTICVPFSHRITPESVKPHLEWTAGPEWGGLISLCGTEEKAQREVEWRQNRRKNDITAYKISTDRLSWRKMEWNPWTTLNALTDEDGNVMIFKATEVIQKMGLLEGLKIEAKWGAMDEWLALEWIPRDMTVQMQRFD